MPVGNTHIAPTQPLIDVLRQRELDSSNQAVDLVHRLAAEVCELHANGLVHRSIDETTVGFDDDQKLRLGTPGPPAEFGGPKYSPETSPPELQVEDPVLLPAKLD